MKAQKKCHIDATKQSNVATIKTSSNYNRPIKKNTKQHAVISYLVAGNRLDRFSAEKTVHDHCLHSTISGFQSRYGILVNREFIQVPGFNDSIVTIAQYWLSYEERKKAARLLEV